MKETTALILAGARGDALTILTKHRPSCALPFGGKYRVIDFALSNCVNSEIYRVGVLTQYSPVSLRDHIGIGRPWDLDRRDGGVKLLQPFVRNEQSNWYRGTADAIRQNLGVIDRPGAGRVVIVSGDSICKMDFSGLISLHEERKARVTLALTPVHEEASRRFGMVEMDGNDAVTSFEEKPSSGREGLAFTGVYVFDAKHLINQVASRPECFDLVRDFVVPMIERGESVAGYVLNDYWEDAGEINAYYNANLALLSKSSRLNLYDPDWVIYTKSEEKPPARIGTKAEVSSSIVGSGCVIDGTVVNSVLFPGVVVGKGALVRDSIVMHGTRISKGGHVEMAILDKRVLVGEGTVISPGENPRSNTRFQRHLSSGISIVGKGSTIPAGWVVRGNSIVDGDLSKIPVPAGKEIGAGSYIVEEEGSGHVA